jgi:hypothetical protein
MEAPSDWAFYGPCVETVRPTPNQLQKARVYSAPTSQQDGQVGTHAGKHGAGSVTLPRAPVPSLSGSQKTTKGMTKCLRGDENRFRMGCMGDNLMCPFYETEVVLAYRSDS